MTWREALPVYCRKMLSAAWLHVLSCWLAMRLHGGLRPQSACCDGSVRSSNKTSAECTQRFTRGIADGTLTLRSGTSRQCCSKVVSIWISGAEATSYIMSRCAPIPTV